MKIQQIGFFDSYGMEHPEAQCFVFSANKNESVSESFYFDKEKGKLESAKSDYCSVTYSIGYWHNQRCLDRGTRTLEIYNPDTLDVNTTFELSDDYKGLSLEDAIWKHFKENVAPKLEATMGAVREVETIAEAKTVKPVEHAEVTAETAQA